MAAVSAPQEIDYSQYLIDPARTIKNEEERQEKRLFTVLTFDDDSEWVVLEDHHVDRFCGYLYLKDKLQGDTTLQPAENRLHLDGKKLRYLSKYCGSTEVVGFQGLYQKMALRDIGFTDVTNLREKDGVIFVFDTEKHSFNEKVHADIDKYRKVHDAALTALNTRNSAPKEN